MPGAFAHMIAAREAIRIIEAKGLKLPDLVLNRKNQWLQAGAVGPDYPYLHHAMTSHDASDSWADNLHYHKTGDVVRAGIGILRERYPTDKDKDAFHRMLAWLYGYASHVVLDASIHPVVRAIVGEYKDNALEHRTCEMYMDSYIYREIYGVELTNSEWADYLRHVTDRNTKGMDSDVVALWNAMLNEVYPEETLKNPPKIDEWHKAYVAKLDLADINIGFFRHLAGEHGILYVKSGDIPAEYRDKYIDEAEIPEQNRFGSQTMKYKDIFDFGVANVASYWEMITKAIEGTGDALVAALPNWDLDTGTIDPKGEGNATLWA